MDRYFKRVATGSFLQTNSRIENSPINQESPREGNRHEDSHVPLNHTDSLTQNSQINASTIPSESVDSVDSLVLKNDVDYNQMTSPMIRKDVANSCYKDVIKAIFEEIGDESFAILVNVFRGVSYKQRMALVLRYVDKRGFVMERLVGLTHVTDSRAESLKDTIYSMLAKLSLNPSRIRGQGYNGASNMRSYIHELVSLIMDDCSSAHFTHCFAEELPLTLVKVAQKHDDVERLIDLVDLALSMIGTSYKRRDEYRHKQAEMVEEALHEGELLTQKGLNQRAEDTHWNCPFKKLCNFINMFSPIVNILDALVLAGDHKIVETQAILDGIQTFDFVFMIHLMKLVLGITYPLNLCLQGRDPNIVNVIVLVRTAKDLFQEARDKRWDSLIIDVKSFCDKHDIDIPSMDELAPSRIRGKSKRKVLDMALEYYYRVNVFYAILDMQMQELNNLFTETSIQLLMGVACLNPVDSFSNYHKEKILKMAQLYPDDFDELSIDCLDGELDAFVGNLSHDDRFSCLSTIRELLRTLIHTGLHKLYPTLYKLLKLVLVLPIFPAFVERWFSTMKFLECDLYNRICDEFLNDVVVTYFERDLLERFSNDNIMCL